MAKNITPALTSHLAQDATTLARCWKITRTDGEVFAFSGADVSLFLPSTPLFVRQSGSGTVSNVSETNDITTFSVIFSQNPDVGNLLIAFVTGIYSSADLNTTDWTVEASDYTNGFQILSRYVLSNDTTTLPSITVGTPIDEGYVAATVQEIGGVTGDHSLDVAYAHIDFSDYSLPNPSITSTAFVPDDPFAFAVVGTSCVEQNGSSAKPVFPGGWLVDQAQFANVGAFLDQELGYGCAHITTYEQSAQVTCSYAANAPSGLPLIFVGMVAMNVPGLTYSPVQGFTNTAIEQKDDMTVDNLEVEGIFNSDSITIQDLRAGKFDFAGVSLFLVNYLDVTQGIMNLRTGVFGECVASPQGWYKAEIRGLNQILQQLIVELYGPECRADVGDQRCTVPIDPPIWRENENYTTVVNMVNTGCWVKAVVNSNTDYSMYGNVIFECTTAGISGTDPTVFTGATTVGDTVTDGGVTWTIRQAWTRTGAVNVVTDTMNFSVTWDSEDARDVDTWYQYGIIQFDSGNNAGRAWDVKLWSKTAEAIQLYVPAGYLVQSGDRFHISPGCDKSATTCISKFNNILNLRGEPYLPGNDFVFYYPDASGSSAAQ